MVYAGTITASIGIIARVLTGPCPVSSWDHNNNGGGSPSPVTPRVFFDTMLCNINDQADALPSDLVALGNIPSFLPHTPSHLLLPYPHIYFTHPRTYLTHTHPTAIPSNHLICLNTLSLPQPDDIGISVLDSFGLICHL